MRIIDDVLNVIGKVVNVVMWAAGFIVGITSTGVVGFSHSAQEKYNDFKHKKWLPSNRE